MKKTEEIEQLGHMLEMVPAEEVSALVALTAARIKATPTPTVYDTLSDEHKAKIARAVERVKQGHTVPAETVFAKISAKLRAAGL